MANIHVITKEDMEKKDTTTNVVEDIVTVEQTPDRYYSDPFEKDGKEYVTIHFDGAVFEYCPILAADIRLIRLAEKLKKVRDGYDGIIIFSKMLNILLDSEDAADDVLDAIAEANDGCVDFITYNDLVEFLGAVSNAVVGEDNIKK